MASGTGDEWVWYALAAAATAILLIVAPSWRRTMSGYARRGDVIVVAVGLTILTSAGVGLLRFVR